MLEFYVCDTETSGLSIPAGQELIEISIIRCSDRVQLSRTVKAERPETASVDALKIQNKTFADLANGISKEQMVEDVEKFFAEDGNTHMGRVLIGHNINFDKRFIQHTWEKCGKEFPVSLYLDTIHLLQAYIKIADPETLNIKKTATGKVSKKLVDACDMLGIKRLSTQHASKEDARNTYLLWKRLTEEKGIDHLPLFKTAVHKIKKDSDYADINDLDMSDVI